MTQNHTRPTTWKRGFMFIELLVGSALITLVFTGLIAAFQLSLSILLQTRAETGALALANERIEYLRSLPYDQVGTISGIPSGVIAQNEAVTLNGISYNRRTLVQYVDSPDDGSGASDTNGITADYKLAKVEVSWTQRSDAKSLFLVTNIIPKSMESLAGGGTLVVNVFNNAAVPIDSANVRVVNTSGTTSVDVTANTNSAGQVIFPGAPAGGGYQIFVSGTGYSSSQTYSASTSNPNPNPPHVSVIAGQVSTVNFAIDLVSQLTVKTVEPPQTYQSQDLFNNASQLVDMSSTTVANGEVALATTSLGYASSGEVFSTTTAPANLVGWRRVMVTASTSPETTVLYRIYSVNASGTRALIPDSLISNNASGLTSSPVDLTGIPAGTYPRLAIGATLTTTDASTTPSILDWKTEYDATNVPIPNIPFTIAGAKNIGTDAGGQPVLKYVTSKTTDANGSSTLSNLESDTYTFSVNGSSGYDVSDICPRSPLAIAPGSSTSTTLVLSPHTTNSLRVFVTTAGGATISGADVKLTKSGTDTTVQTSSCGSAFFDGLTSGNTYTVETSKSGYVTDTLTNVNISGQTTLTITLAP